MSDNIKLVIEIPKGALKLLNTTGVDWLDAEHILSAVAHGIPLDTVKAEIEKAKQYKGKNTNPEVEKHSIRLDRYYDKGLDKALKILDNIRKADMSGKSCSTCKNSDDEFSGECYECLKGIFDHYEPEEVDE